ncbi:unnamed protein product [Parnassius apollo]|uniref:(apollo) hypothetical protein n=1 Tax=Parnassius apollo TaxID=110799 RepID=A0A8S3W1Z8_PARAO|nr:unnamed protein product [Parnassius apollo]
MYLESMFVENHWPNLRVPMLVMLFVILFGKTKGNMGRSPSPRRRDERRDRRDRDRDRDRERRRQRTRSRSRSLERRRRSPDRRRSPSPRRRRSRSPSPIPTTSFVPKPKKAFGERPIVTPADLEGKTPEEQEMLKVMGFCGFDTTKELKMANRDQQIELRLLEEDEDILEDTPCSDDEESDYLEVQGENTDSEEDSDHDLGEFELN